MRKGHFSIDRQIEDYVDWLSEPFTRSQAWIDLILLAAWEDRSFFIRGNPIMVKRGQVAESQETLAKRWQWSRGKVERFLRMLKMRQQIEQQKTAAITLISIINYDKFQKVEQQTGGRQAADRAALNKLNKLNNNISTNVDIKNISPRADKRDTRIDELMGSFKTLFGLSDFKESQQWQRIYAKHLVSLSEKIGKDEFMRRVDVFAADSFKIKNCNSLKYLYEQLKSTPNEAIARAKPNAIPTFRGA